MLFAVREYRTAMYICVCVCVCVCVYVREREREREVSAKLTGCAPWQGRTAGNTAGKKMDGWMGPSEKAAREAVGGKVCARLGPWRGRL